MAVIVGHPGLRPKQTGLHQLCFWAGPLELLPVCPPLLSDICFLSICNLPVKTPSLSASKLLVQFCFFSFLTLVFSSLFN